MAASAVAQGRSGLEAQSVLPIAVGSLALIAPIIGPGVATTLGLVFFLLGTMHGAGDEQDRALKPFGLLSGLAYVAAGLAVAALFVGMPLAGLTLFLALSLWHFARSLDGGLTRGIAYAALATGGSMLFRYEETAAIFSSLTGEPIPMAWLVLWVGIGAVGACASLISLTRRPSDEVLWLTLGAVAVLHPVLAVGTAFLIGHAIPIQREQSARYGWKAVLIAQGPTTAIALVASAVLLALWLNALVALPVLAALAFGFATPHMLAERLER